MSGLSIRLRLLFAAALAACALTSPGCTGPGLCLHGGNWKFKIGTDPDAPKVSLQPVETTIDELIAKPHVDRPPKGARIVPEELTTYVVRDVELRGYQRSPDGDVHMMIGDEHGHTMIIEATPPFCTDDESPWREQIASVRAAVDDEIPMAVLGWRGVVMSVAGIGYFDFLHGQFGVAENGIELHPILAICFGRGCTLPDPAKGAPPASK